MNMKNQSKAYLFALLAVLLWATVATAFKISLGELNYIQVLFTANLTSLLIYFLMLVFQRKLHLVKPASASEIGLSALQGFLNPFAYYLILLKAYSLLPAQVAQPVNFIWPVVLIILSAPLLKQPITLTAVLGLTVSLAGVFILATQGDLSTLRISEPRGVALALSTSVIWSLYWIINLRDKRDDLIKLFTGFLFSMIYILILSSFTGNIPDLFSKSVVPAVYVGAFEMGITFFVWLKALQLSDSTGKIANLIYITPFLSLVCIHLVLNEKLLYTSFIGLCVIIAGILIGRIKNERV